nr:hypothetical protein [Pseudorhodoplanes sinuspersici]
MGVVPALCLGLDQATPDETTLCRLRNALKVAGLDDALFVEVTRQLDEAFTRELEKLEG